jgi:peptidoglycan/LPS O-acetylase OafA/YrhL
VVTAGLAPRGTGVLPSTGRYDELTAVRAIASLAVVATHAAYWTGNYVHPTWGLPLARLDFGVALFFVLSGFLLFRKWVSATARQSRMPAVSRYFKHRFWRIVPGYWVAVAAAFILVESPGEESVRELVRTLTMTQVYGDAQQHLGLTQMWSLTVEAAFYLLLPVFALVAIKGLCRGLWKPSRLLAATLALGAVSVVWYVVTRTVVSLPLNSIFWLPGYLSWFAGGMALAVWAVQREGTSGRTPRIARYVMASPGGTWLIAFALLLVACTAVAGEATLVPLPLFDALSKNLLYAAAATLLVAPLTLGATGGPMTNWLKWPPLMWLGDISYEIFLLHLVVLEGVMAVFDYPVFTGNPWFVFVFTAAGSIMAARLLKSAVDLLVRVVPARLTD